MFQYRQVLVRLRQGDTDREIARARLMGRRKSAELRILAETHGWLEPHTRLPEDAEIAQRLATAKRASSTVSTLEPYRDLIVRWVEQRVNGVAIHAALKREHGYTGSYSSVYRMLQAIAARRMPPCRWSSSRVRRRRSTSAPALFFTIRRRAGRGAPGAS